MPSIPVKAPVQILITPAQMNPEVSITSHLSSLFYLWGGALKINEEKMNEMGLDLKVLFHSSKDSWTVPFQEGVLNADALERSKAVRTGPFPLGVLVQGTFPDVFEGQKAPPWTGIEAPSEEPAEEQEAKPSVENKPGKLILFGASSFFNKHLIPRGGHGTLFLNSIDALTLGEELVEIRSKHVIDRSLGRISAGQKLFWRLFVTVLVPLLIAALGTARVFWRRQTKQNYLKKRSRTETEKV